MLVAVEVIERIVVVVALAVARGSRGQFAGHGWHWQPVLCTVAGGRRVASIWRARFQRGGRLVGLSVGHVAGDGARAHGVRVVGLPVSAVASALVVARGRVAVYTQGTRCELVYSITIITTR